MDHLDQTKAAAFRRSQNWRTTKAIVSLALAASSSGCCVAMHHAFVASKPSYATTVAAWPALKFGEGRLVILLPRLPAGGSSPMPGKWDGSTAIVDFDVDGTRNGRLLDQTFCFLDLKEGAHQVVMRSGKPQTAEIKIIAGKITYVQLFHTQFERGAPIVLTESEAQKALADLYHMSDLALPLSESGLYGGGDSAPK